MTCFNKGEPAAKYTAILATGDREVRENGWITYRWRFKVPKPPSADATIFVYTVAVSAESLAGSIPASAPIIEEIWGGYTVD